MTFPTPPHSTLGLDDLATLDLGDFRKCFQRLFTLTCVFVPHKATALSITTAVFKEVETASRGQLPRFRDKPKGAREKVWIPDWAVAHRLLYRRVEFYERQAEKSPLTFGLWARSIVKHLNWEALRGGNSAWAAVSRSTIFQMSAGQTAGLHAIVAQNNSPSLNRTKDEDSIRRMKGVFMRSFKRRFEEKLKEMRGAHGEKRFLDFRNPKLRYGNDWPAYRPELMDSHFAIVRTWLRALKPWHEEFEPGFCYSGLDPDTEQFFDLERMRMFFDPDDYESILKSARLAPSKDCMSFPLITRRMTDYDSYLPENLAQDLTDAELDAAQQELAIESGFRHAGALGRLVLLVDGQEYETLDSVSGSVSLSVPEGAEFIQVVNRQTDRDVVLATHLITYGEPETECTADCSVESDSYCAKFSFSSVSRYYPVDDCIRIHLRVGYQCYGVAKIARNGTEARSRVHRLPNIQSSTTVLKRPGKESKTHRAVGPAMVAESSSSNIEWTGWGIAALILLALGLAIFLHRGSSSDLAQHELKHSDTDASGSTIPAPPVPPAVREDLTPGAPLKDSRSTGSVYRPKLAKESSVVTEPAYALINSRVAQNQSQFYVYEDVDSPFNHGFPSGLFGSSAAAMAKLTINPGCIYSATAADGCATDPTALDRTRGTVFQLTWAPLAAGEFAGLNFEEQQNWGVTQTGRGYDLTGATQLVFDAISPTGGLPVQISVNGSATSYLIPAHWTTVTIDLSSLNLTSLTGVHLLFGIASNNFYAPNGGTVLIDNVHFLPVPTSQTTALGFPLANQVFGVERVQNALSGSIPIPPDQTNSGLATLYESSLAEIALIDRGQPQDLTSAQLIADTLVYALANDNQGDPLPTTGGGSGEHNGTYAGDIALFNSQGTSQGPAGGQQGQDRLAGFTATGLCPQTGFCLVLDGATGGNNAFAMLALLAAYKQFQTPAYLSSALTIGNWIYGNLLDTSGTGYGGYFIGYPDQGLPKILQTGKSTENNADIFSAFTALASAEATAGNSSAASLWTARANVAGDFVMHMLDSVTNHFFAGTVPATQSAGAGIYPNGAQQGNDVINTFDFLDSQTFTTLAMAASQRYQNQIDWRLPVEWAASHFQSAVTAGSSSFEGFDLIEASEHLSTDGPAGIAWEFTGQEIAAMELVDSLYGTSQFASSISVYLNQLGGAQTTAPFADGSGVVASTLQDGDTVAPYSQCLVTPYQCIAERVGLAATVWGIFAHDILDPFLSAQSQLTQTISFAPLSNVAVGAPAFSPPASASSGLPVAFTSNTPSVCSVSGLTVSILISGGCSITATQTGNADYAPANPVTQKFTVTFSDVPTTDVFYDEINAFAQRGITAGCGNNNFCPGVNVTRDQMAIFIVRAIYGSDNFTYTTTPYFTDVTPSSFGFKWIQKLKDLGITAGCTATTYCPGVSVTRDQMAVFIIRARLGVSIAGAVPTFSYPSTPYFTDATATEFAFPWIQRMKLEGITSGCAVVTYCPTLAVTREQMATFIMRGAFNQFLPPGTPILSGISPATLPLGTSATYTITGANTNFVQGTTQLSPIPGVTVGTITVNSPTSMTVQLTAAADAVAQPYSILAVTGSEQDVLPNGLILQ